MVETVPGPTVPPLVITFHILNDATLTLATRTKEMTISIAFSLKIHKSARFPLQMIHDILITKVPAIQSYHPYIRCSFQLCQQPRMWSLCTPESATQVCIWKHLLKSSKSTQQPVPLSPFCMKKTPGHEAVANGRDWPSCDIQDHLLLH